MRLLFPRNTTEGRSHIEIFECVISFFLVGELAKCSHIRYRKFMRSIPHRDLNNGDINKFSRGTRQLTGSLRHCTGDGAILAGFDVRGRWRSCRVREKSVPAPTLRVRAVKLFLRPLALAKKSNGIVSVALSYVSLLGCHTALA